MTVGDRADGGVAVDTGGSVSVLVKPETGTEVEVPTAVGSAVALGGIRVRAGRGVTRTGPLGALLEPGVPCRTRLPWSIPALTFPMSPPEGPADGVPVLRRIVPSSTR